MDNQTPGRIPSLIPATLLVASSAAFAAPLYVASDVTLTDRGTPYVMSRDIVILETATVTIEQGVAVELDSLVSVVVYGRLELNGVSGDPVIVTNFDPLHGWGTILAYQGGTVHVERSRLEGGGAIPKEAYPVQLTAMLTGLDGTVELVQSELGPAFGGALRTTDSELIVEDNQFNSLRGEVLDMTLSTGVVRGNQIDQSGVMGEWDAIEADGTTSMIVAGNTVDNPGDDGIDLGFFVGVVEDNCVSGAPDRGIQIETHSTATLRNNCVLNCRIGIVARSNSVVLSVNNTVADCDTGAVAQQGPGYSGASLELRNTILWPVGTGIWADTLSSVDATYSLIEGGHPGTGNIDADPLFVDLSSGDIHLSAGSPCIDAGTDDEAPLLDYEGDARWDDPATPNTGVGAIDYIDIGADELTAASRR